MDEQYKEFKKIALRFLKERGLFNSWKEYLHAKYYNHKKIGGAAGIGYTNWYKKNYIDRIFGQENFTVFLEIYSNYYVCGSISDEFRSYVNTFYPNKYPLFGKFWGTRKKLFDKDTHTFIKSTTNEEE